MKTLRELLLLTLLLLALQWEFAGQAQGLQYTANGYLSVNLTNAASTAAKVYGTATTWNAAIGPIRQKSIAVQAEFKNDAATSTTHTLYYQLSTDGVSYGPLTPAAFTMATVSQSTQVTNIALNGCGYINFAYMTNASGTVNLTNGWVRVPINYNAP